MGKLFDRLTGSPSWARLQERSPHDADQFTTGIKHDVVNVLQALAAAADEALEHALRADAALEQLKRDLYQPDEGDFAKLRTKTEASEREARKYVDGRMSTWSKWLSGIAGGIAVAAFAYIARGGT